MGQFGQSEELIGFTREIGVAPVGLLTLANQSHVKTGWVKNNLLASAFQGIVGSFEGLTGCRAFPGLQARRRYGIGDVFTIAVPVAPDRKASAPISPPCDLVEFRLANPADTVVVGVWRNDSDEYLSGRQGDGIG